ncbi:sporulation protein YtfJ [mine drainage metagenome]|uniref:Sporulation protein YtfJ n=1 Tax=mine drainage metagenome TaxID=410659 RepID=T1C734_9ZZZZ
MSEHPIQGLMTTAMQSIKDMIDVNTVIGDAVESQDGGVVIPVSRVSFGFAAGGGEYGAAFSRKQHDSAATAELPFGGGSGAGVSVQPVGFLVMHHENVRFIPIDQNALVERVIDQAPELSRADR